jgi:hypothetical protein
MERMDWIEHINILLENQRTKMIYKIINTYYYISLYIIFCIIHTIIYCIFCCWRWKILLEENSFQSITTVNIWSDDGPKHFKISSNMKFLAIFQHNNTEIDWNYHFFPVYYECSICIIYAKKKVTNSMINSNCN